MKTVLKSDFECVYSVNGRITEGGRISLTESEVYYITVFPLSAVYLPYTVKTVGNRIHSNKELCVRITVKDLTYLLFCKRYPYVYSPTPYACDGGTVKEFFSLVKQNKFDKARGLMSKALSESVSNDALKGFFEKYEYVLDTEVADEWILATKEGEGEYFTFVLRHGLIEDISN